jgi:Transglutaminase-like superfamily/TgpA N-terminal domain
MGRARTAAIYVLPAAAIVIAWMRIEGHPHPVGHALLLALVALAPALVPGRRLRVAAAAVALVLGSWLAVGASLATPGRVVTRLWDGAREFYDVDLPFDPAGHARMQGAVLLAIFVFCLLLALALSARRALLAVLVLALGAGWPGTLLWGGSELTIGGLILAGALVILAGSRPRAKTAFYPAAVAGALVVACALGLSSRPAVAKDEFLHWQSWDLYTKAHGAVGVSYVWDSNYSGLNWPRKRTVVFKVEAPDRPFYWRATTLDSFTDNNWREDLETARPYVLSGERAELVPSDVSRKGWVEQKVTNVALLDRHLVGAEEPVAFAPRGMASVSYANDGIALVIPAQAQGHTYAVWSIVRHPSPERLARSKPDYPMPISVDNGAFVPPFGSRDRDRRVEETIAARTPAYAPLYEAAKGIVGRAKHPYAAVVAIESWLRDSGRFSYDEHPPVVPGAPPLVSFVTETQRGYCQHFAGAMALMLRYLGIPARVAAGFASGTYSKDQWTVTDHDAHTWVEVWFDGYGWLPFDPTPGRGRLAGSYSASSKSFDPGTAAALVGSGTAIQRLLRNEALTGSSVRGEHARSVPVAPSNTHRTLLIVGVLLLALAGLALTLVALKAGRRRARYRSDDPRAVGDACRRELSEILLDQRIDVPRSATLKELGELLDSQLEVGADVFVDAAGGARFAAPGVAGDAAVRARREARELRRVLRQRLSTFERLSGALSLRSLRSA